MLREIVSNDWFTILLVFAMGLVAFAKLIFATRFDDFSILIGNSKYLKIYAREQKFIDTFDSILYANLIVSVTLFIMIIAREQSESFDLSMNLFLKIAFGIGVILLIKVLLERLLGSLFEIDTLIDSYLFQKISYRNFIGLVLIPVNIFLLYVITPSTYVVYGAILVIVIINIIGIVTTIKNHQKLLINNLFYFILYLCALEISPYIILYKLFVK